MTPIETQQAVALLVGLTIGLAALGLAGVFAVLAIVKRLFPGG